MATLFDAVTIGSLHLKNRIFMAPLTRSRATGADGRTPNALMKEYYVQRASAGMILTEATAVTPMGVGYANTPGIWSDEHVAGWKEITSAVHAAGGIILLQLWHVGRVSHPLFLNGALPVAPSAIAPEGHVSIVRPETPFVVPRALTLSEIPHVVEEYRKGAENAKRAGFDGVEIHGANGYLIDQFLQDGSNKRNDQYGGSIENRARFMMEVADAVLSVWPSDKVGMHLSPRGGMSSMTDSNPVALFTYVAEQLSEKKLAFICTREFVADDSVSPHIRKAFRGAFIGNEKYDLDSATAAVEKGDVDAVAFGKAFLANPDLVKRFKERAALNPFDAPTFYSSGPHGYTDYPSL